MMVRWYDGMIVVLQLLLWSLLDRNGSEEHLQSSNESIKTKTRQKRIKSKEIKRNRKTNARKGQPNRSGLHYTITQ